MKNIINKVLKKIATNNSNTFKLFVITVIIIVSSLIYILVFKNNNNVIKINSKEMKSEYGKVCVYISGAVKNPGVYKFNQNIILKEAINIIGGVNENADISKINLDKYLLNLEKIFIPEHIKETEEMIEEKTENFNNLININNASKEELMTLDGIGESTANKIIEYRKVSRFEDIEDIKSVSGIGESKYNKIKDNICTE